MKQLIITAVILLPLVFITSCNPQAKAEPAQVNPAITSNSYNPFLYNPFWLNQNVHDYKSDKPKQIAEYGRRIFKDSRGNLWFENAIGVCRYDGDKILYFSTYNGLSGHQVTGILEDQRGNIWISTNGGISMYDGKLFTNFTEKTGLSSNYVRSIYEDNTGTIWAGTEQGLCRYNPEEEEAKFSTFTLPQADVFSPKSRFSAKLVSAIMEDKSGNLWFGTDGAGVYHYDPSAEKTGAKQFTHITMEDGLCDNSILCIIEDSEGNIWFGSRFGGLSRYNPLATTAAGKSFTNFTVEGGDVGNNEVGTIYEDRAGNIWFSSEGYGIYRFKDNQLSHFGKGEGFPVDAVQSIFEDKKNRLLIDSGKGLYSFDGKRFKEFTRDNVEQGC